MSSWSELRKNIDSLNVAKSVAKYFPQKPTKKDSGEPSSEVIKSITPKGNRIFEGERPDSTKIDLQPSYANSEFLRFLEDFFKEEKLDFDCSITIYLSASISEKSIKNIFCDAMNKYKELNGL